MTSGDLSGSPRSGGPRPLLFFPRAAQRTARGGGASAGIVSVVDKSGGSRGSDTTRQFSGYGSRTMAGGSGGGGGGGSAWRAAARTDAEGGDGETGSVIAAAATARLAEAWSLLEASEAARRRLSEEVKGWADRTAGLEEALAAAEATVETRAREARLLAAGLQDARDGLALEEAARREAEGRADALRFVEVVLLLLFFLVW